MSTPSRPRPAGQVPAGSAPGVRKAAPLPPAGAEQPSPHPPDGSAGSPPNPLGGWSESILELDDALVVPPAESGTIQPCGVLERTGAFCRQAVTWRGRRAMMTPPPAPAGTPRKLPGRHLFAGQIWSHFGHFLAESLPRLWALDKLAEKPQSIVFIPKRPDQPRGFRRYQQEFFRLLGLDLELRILTEPTRVERLIVPGQGFGLGEIAAGTASFRAYMRRNFAPEVAAEGPPRLYLSRSRLGGLEGGIVLEGVLEANLADSGYETFHPQNAPLARQIARYRAAERIIGPDGSAFHLFGFVATDRQKAGIILRRNSGVYQNLATQIEGFSGNPPAVLRAVRADWIPEGKSRPGRYSFGQLDFENLRNQLAAEGFIEPACAWKIPRYQRIRRAMARISDQKGLFYRPLPAGSPRGGAAAAPAGPDGPTQAAGDAPRPVDRKQSG